MSLASLIKKRPPGFATAIPAISATSATKPTAEPGTVARVATVAVATPVSRKAIVPPDLLAMLDAAVAAGLYDSDERRILLTSYAADPDGVALLIEDMHSRLNRCRQFEHLRRPGLFGGYCTARDDLPIIYGLLRELPADRGAWCHGFEAAEPRR